MAARAQTPGSPKTAAVAVVTPFIGKNRPLLAPKILIQSKASAPNTQLVNKRTNKRPKKRGRKDMRAINKKAAAISKNWPQKLEKKANMTDSSFFCTSICWLVYPKICAKGLG